MIAIGCREAAKKQQTMNSMRKSGAAYLRRKSSAGLEHAKNLRFKNATFFKMNKGLIDLENGSIGDSVSDERADVT